MPTTTSGSAVGATATTVSELDAFKRKVFDYAFQQKAEQEWCDAGFAAAMLRLRLTGLVTMVPTDNCDCEMCSRWFFDPAGALEPDDMPLEEYKRLVFDVAEWNLDRSEMEDGLVALGIPFHKNTPTGRKLYTGLCDDQACEVCYDTSPKLIFGSAPETDTTEESK